LKVLSKMRKISILVTAFITSLVMTLSGLAVISVASAASNQTVTKSFTFSTGNSAITSAQKTALKKVVTTSGKTATFQITAAAGKLPGVSDKAVQALATKRGQAVTAYLVKLGVKKSNITITVKITKLGIVPKTKLVGTNASATPTTPALTCGNGGNCVLGGTGTGGGIIYYVDSSVEGFACGPTLASTCHYLEVAPSGWNTLAESNGLIWAVTNQERVDVSDITNENSANNTSSGIGLGYINSDAIVTQGNDTTTAAGAARAYSKNSKTDWYLPTTSELNLLCQWNRGVAQSVTTACSGGTLNSPVHGASLSGFVDYTYYWASSEYGPGVPRFAWSQLFSDGSQNAFGKSNGGQVRPVRAF